MVFDEYFYRLTGGKGIDGNDVVIEINPFKPDEKEEKAAIFGLKAVSSDHLDHESYETVTRHPDSSDYSKGDYVIESDLIFPKINRAVKTSEKPVVLVIDDDFSTLDLLKIYLMRDYSYYGFSTVKEGLLFLNDNVADLILFDCNINTTPSSKVVSMIRQFRHCKDVPIIYMGSEGELMMVKNALPDGVKGVLKRPVARGDLQKVLDEYIHE